MTTPPISVLMSVYNGAAFLQTAVTSILAQSFADFEFIIINDGSTDATADILATFTDPRLHIVHQANIGLTRSLNRGLMLCHGRYIARMDADDEAMPHRLQTQFDYMQARPDVVVLGSGYRQLDLLRHRQQDIILPETDDAIRRAMLSGNPFCHPAVLIRRDALLQVGGYDESFRYTQDYELWSRLGQHGRFHNLPHILLIRRYHQHSVSNNLRQEGLRLWLFMRANSRAIRRLGHPWYHQLRVLTALRFLPLDIYIAIRSKLAARNQP